MPLPSDGRGDHLYSARNEKGFVLCRLCGVTRRINSHRVVAHAQLHVRAGVAELRTPRPDRLEDRWRVVKR